MSDGNSRKYYGSGRGNNNGNMGGDPKSPNDGKDSVRRSFNKQRGTPTSGSPPSNQGARNSAMQQGAGDSSVAQPTGQTPTTTSPTSGFPTVTKDQILSMAGGMVSIKYFDEQLGAWGMRRPAVSTAQPSPKSFTCCTIALGNWERSGTDNERAAALNDVLSQHCPTFVAMLEVTETFFAAMQQQPMVRRHYAATDLARCYCTLDGGVRGAEPAVLEHGCVFLIRNHVHVDFAELQPRLYGDKNKTNPRPFVLLHMRNFSGFSCTLGAAHFDPCGTFAERCAAVTAAINKMDAVDIVAIAANFGDHVVDAKDQDLRRELSDVMRSFQMVDVFEACMETVNMAPVSLWLKQPGKVYPQSVSPLGGDRRWCRFGSLAVLPFRTAANNNNTAVATATSVATPAVGAAVGAPASNGLGSSVTTPSGIAIPQPRSAKGTLKNSPSPTVLADPAVLAVDEKLPPTTASLARENSNAAPPPPPPPPKEPKEGIDVASIFPQVMKHRQLRWRKDTAFHIKGSNRNLSQDESLYDLSTHFSSVAEAIETLNSGAFQWAADFFIVNSTIIAAEHVAQCDLKAFRRYVQSKPNPWVLIGADRRDRVDRSAAAASEERSQQGGNANNSNNGGGVNVAQLLQEKVRREARVPNDDAAPTNTADGRRSVPATVTSAQQAAVSHHHHHAAVVHTHSNGPVIRPRVWSESCCTLLYQITPREMKFDISHLVGVMRGNLKSAITRLNTKKTMAAALSEKPDPLLDYGYDYALLYCPERQGYWLLSASDVPCDVVSCRQAAL